MVCWFTVGVEKPTGIAAVPIAMAPWKDRDHQTCPLAGEQGYIPVRSFQIRLLNSREMERASLMVNAQAVYVSGHGC
jgi:hypothetical protein